MVQYCYYYRRTYLRATLVAKDQPRCFSQGGNRMKFDLYVPEDFESLLDYLATNGRDAVLVGGGTDLLPRIKRRLLKPKLLVDLSSLHELDYVRRSDGRIKIGALTTISELAESPVLSGRLEAFSRVAARFGGPAIRNIATVGGNIAAAASSEDLITVLLALDADVRTRSAYRERVTHLREFIVGKRRTVLEPEELITEISFPELDVCSWCTFEKVGRRNSLVIALVSLSVCIKLDPSNRTINWIRVALNRIKGKTPERAVSVEKGLTGKILDEARIAEGVRLLGDELRLTSDYRASAAYRSDAARACFETAIGRCVEGITGRSGNDV